MLFKVLLVVTCCLRYCYLTDVTSAARNGGQADCVWLHTAVNWKGQYFIELLILILLSAIHTRDLLYRQNLLIGVNIFGQFFSFYFQIQK